jgi:hypothetical protein
MESAAILPVSSHEVSASKELPKSTLKISKTSNFVKKFFQSIETLLHNNHASGYIQKLPLRLRTLVPVCLDLAATAIIPFDEAISMRLPSINLGIAAVQGVFSLRSIGRKINKSVLAVKEKRLCTAKLKEVEKRLLLTTNLETLAHILLGA